MHAMGICEGDAVSAEVRVQAAKAVSDESSDRQRESRRSRSLERVGRPDEGTINEVSWLDLEASQESENLQDDAECQTLSEPELTLDAFRWQEPHNPPEEADARRS